MPLRGRTIVVTRAAEQAPPLAGALEAMGAHVVALPTIAITVPPSEEPIRSALAQLETFSWIVLTSVNAVDRFFGYLAEAGLSLPPLVRVAVVGQATAAAIRARGIEPSLIPADFRAEGLIQEFDRIGDAPAGARVLVPRALVAREILPEHLASLGYDVVVTPVYETVPAPRTGADAEIVRTADGITFTSPTTARFLFEGIRELGEDPNALLATVALFSIGPVTTAELVRLGVDRTRIVETERSLTDDLVREIVRVLGDGAAAR